MTHLCPWNAWNWWRPALKRLDFLTRSTWCANLWPTTLQMLAFKDSLISPNFPSASSLAFVHVGTCIVMPVKLGNWVWGTLEDVVDSKPTTSEPWLKNWHLNVKARKELPVISMPCGVVAWGCTPNPGSEQGKYKPKNWIKSKTFIFFLKFTLQSSQGLLGKIEPQHRQTILRIHVQTR